MYAKAILAFLAFLRNKSQSDFGVCFDFARKFSPPFLLVLLLTLLMNYSLVYYFEYLMKFIGWLKSNIIKMIWIDVSLMSQE